MQIFQDSHRFKVIAAGRRFGKSTLAITDGVCAALDTRNTKKLPVFLIAPTQAQAKLIYWRPLIDKLHPVVAGTNINEGLITLNNGVLVGVKGADNPDALRGAGLWRAILDEYASMKPVTWEDIIRPALADVRGGALFIGTPAGRNHFFDLYQNAASGVDPDWKAWHFESTDNPFLPEGEVEAARRTMSTAAFNKEFRASFETGSGGHFKREWLKYADEPKEGFWFVALDLAGFADVKKAETARQRLLDESVIVVAKVGLDGDWWIADIQHGRWGVMECAKRIVDVVLKREPTAWGMERGALYNAVLPQIMSESMRRNHLLQQPVPLTHENRIKTERILWALQGRMEHGKISFARASWNTAMEDQMLQFPSRMVHDDIPDAISYIAQLSQGRMMENFDDLESEPYWRPQDEAVGF